MTAEKTRENRLRRLAYRMGFQLNKLKVPFVGAAPDELFILASAPRKQIVVGEYGATLDQIEAYLTSPGIQNIFSEYSKLRRPKAKSAPKRKSKE